MKKIPGEITLAY